MNCNEIQAKNELLAFVRFTKNDFKETRHFVIIIITQ